ncbi:hypothetical protein AKJ42_01890 [candidate division MSBL1 archaeon SCGC-AAA261C02]|uniref:Uncharacterized protein n=1 Tax=candidate division MSBL1 archaeon SCGC-AAA261C02 TaxID=1698272 RepID=A0A133V0Q0_9EURY|nr:hypothetical protein AKJ42_01890 [candidate division MSBL1 archaeon SCGC-AAA261C02]
MFYIIETVWTEALSMNECCVCGRGGVFNAHGLGRCGYYKCVEERLESVIECDELGEREKE